MHVEMLSSMGDTSAPICFLFNFLCDLLALELFLVYSKSVVQ